MQATIQISRLHGGLCDCLARHVWFTKQACLANVHDGLVDDGIWHENDGLPELKPVLVAQRQLRAVPQVPRIPMISSLCSAPHDKKDNDVERSLSETLFMVHSSQTATSTEVETWLLLPFTRACFLTTLTFRALRGNHIVTVTPAVYPRLF